MLQSIIFLRPSQLVKRNRFSILLSLLLCLAAPSGYSQDTPKPDSPDSVTLEVGTAMTREFVGETEAHLYRLTLSANQYASVIVEQHGVDVSARVWAADGQAIAYVNAVTTAQGMEKVELVAETTGSYQIEIKPALPKVFAGKYAVRLSETRAATAQEKLLDEARRKFHEAVRLSDAGKYDEALELARRALEIREQTLSANHADVAASLLVVSKLSLVKNNFTEAENHIRRAMDMTTKTAGEDSLSYADALSLLARIRSGQTNYAEAETLHRQSLAIREKAAGANSLAAADSLHLLAVLYRAMNDHPKAELNFTKALSIYENLLGEDRFEVAGLLNDFGLFYYGAGDFEKAAALLLRSLASKERLFPTHHRQLGIALNNLGLVAWKKKDYAKAKHYYLRALSVFEIANGPESDGVAGILGNLAVIYKEGDGNLAKSEEYQKRALAITEKTAGEFNIFTAHSVSSLAIIYRVMGDLDRAEQFGLRALTIYERVLGEYNHYTLLAHGNLVRIYAAKGDANRAVEQMMRLTEIHEKVIPLNLRIGSERQKIAYYQQTQRFDNTITLHAELASGHEQMRDLAITAILRHKGRVLDAVSDNLMALRRRFDAEDQQLLDKLNDINAGLSKIILSSRQKISAAEQQQQLKALEAEREKLESEISRRSAGFYEPSVSVTLDAVRAGIPPDAALVEFAIYLPFKWEAGMKEPDYGAPRYIAYVVRPTGAVRWKDLGEAKVIDAAVSEFRQALREPTSSNMRHRARAVDEKIMQPIRALTGDVRQLLISPDGDLNLIPFEALMDEKGRYLIENYSFAYLTSGRDLLRMQRARTSKNKSLIIANPLFGARPGDMVASVKAVQRRSITATRNLSETYFAPLGGTVQEARSIQDLFPDWNMLTGAEATETTLKQTAAPRILHIATHGFFLENESHTAQIENPLLRSGLALAGANRRVSAAGGDDGVLTALEASGLNLWGTKLVVLSACDTGLGEVKNGEGVYGLRRAFVLAGSESLLMSLWPVSDYVTRELMKNYYKNLKGGMRRDAALRQVQLEMLKRKEREHPFYWAAFIQSGEWANLDGRR